MGSRAVCSGGIERKGVPVHETISRLLAAASKLSAAILASMQTRKWWWAGGGGAALVAIAAAVVVFGGFFGPSGKAICTVALQDARDYGVVPNTAALANSDAKSTDVENRRLCTAVAGGDTYNITADVATGDTADLKCKDITKNPDCVTLYSVQRTDGLTTYQVRQVPDDDTDAAVAPDNGQAAADDDAQNSDGTQNAGGAAAADDSEVAPATGTNSGDASQQQPDAGPPPQ